MPAFHEQAVTLAQAFSSVEGVFVTPDPPHTNAFLVLVGGEAKEHEYAREEVARRTGVWLYDYAPASPYEGFVSFEVHIWTTGMKIRAEEARMVMSLYAELVRSNGNRPRMI